MYIHIHNSDDGRKRQWNDTDFYYTLCIYNLFIKTTRYTFAFDVDLVLEIQKYKLLVLTLILLLLLFLLLTCVYSKYNYKDDVKSFIASRKYPTE